MVELGSECIWFWFLEKKQTNTCDGSYKGFMIQKIYSTKNYVSKIVQPL
jgi:hypothetical protein